MGKQKNNNINTLIARLKEKNHEITIAQKIMEEAKKTRNIAIVDQGNYYQIP